MFNTIQTAILPVHTIYDSDNSSACQVDVSFMDHAFSEECDNRVILLHIRLSFSDNAFRLSEYQAVCQNSLERLNFKASHDELTGAYNRSGYELLLSSVDLSTTHLILFDLDNFKGINDNYGHETGDRVLKKLVDTLKNNFRIDDYICRIGGDEFVVFMVHSSPAMKNLITTKIENINNQLSEETDGIPPISTSVGIVHGTDVKDSSTLFEKADEAMYKSKQKGKRTLTFYS